MGERCELKGQDLEYMELPREFWGAKLDHVPESVRPTITRYVERIEQMRDQTAGLLLHGAPGVGKTSIASVVAKALRAVGTIVYFTSVWDLREGIRQHGTTRGDVPVMDRCREVEVLVLDDVRAEDAREAILSLRQIEDLVRSRGSRRLLTILTTRLSISDMYDLSFASSLEAYVVALKVDGPSLRADKNARLRTLVLGTDEQRLPDCPGTKTSS